MSEIVVGYDGSPAGEAALTAALDLAAPLGDKVVVVFGYAPPGPWGGEIAEHEEAIEELGERLMAKARAQASQRGAEIEEQLVGEAPGRRADRGRRRARGADDRRRQLKAKRR